ncbi:dioxygenase [Wolbachia endosymbiont of Dipetalonema caudispina]|uniref:protocatechuate 3,4-dioxygenase n=1 Tax=Wolbachia endosymbiont of Dipetalonema caudispina TaxID=1812112 RepID=UPI00158E5A49|nr:protocatechuate 3,4-dioxygenase [Wolbachia endosymbiont of Dipetalonema caudispina]QKX00925.1 dioxygenase [Wolbachia endosymbiont of Dipetalonema caudispina]
MTKVKVILLAFLIQNILGLSSLATDPILLNCIKTPEIYNLDPQPKHFHFSNNLRRKPGSPVSAIGELINIVGRITDINCLPIQNAVVFIWHVNSHGMNNYDENIKKDKFDPNFIGSGRFITNNLGYYSFITIAPGKIKNMAPHINFLVQHPDFPNFKTQMFFIDHNYTNCVDPNLSNLIDNGLASLLIAPFIYNNRATKTYIFNITLNSHNKFSSKK